MDSGEGIRLEIRGVRAQKREMKGCCLPDGVSDHIAKCEQSKQSIRGSSLATDLDC